MLYFAFVRPHLLHGIELYANTSSVHLSKIMTLNNKILHILQNQPYNSPVKDLYAEYNTLPILNFISSNYWFWFTNLYTTDISCLVYFLITSKIIRVSTVMIQGIKQISICISVNTTYSQKIIQSCLWNDLPQSAKDVVSINKFKQSVKLFLFN